MGVKNIRAFRILLLGYTVFHTDAAVTVTAHNTLPDRVSFEKGSQGLIMCTINPYKNYFYWEIDNSKVAECILTSCPVTSTATNYNFTFDTTNGIFNISINPVYDIDDGKEFKCHDGSSSHAFNVTVKETEDGGATSSNDDKSNVATIVGGTVGAFAGGAVIAGGVYLVAGKVKSSNKGKQQNTQAAADKKDKNSPESGRRTETSGNKKAVEPVSDVPGQEVNLGQPLQFVTDVPGQEVNLGQLVEPVSDVPGQEVNLGQPVEPVSNVPGQEVNLGQPVEPVRDVPGQEVNLGQHLKELDRQIDFIKYNKTQTYQIAKCLEMCHGRIKELLKELSDQKVHLMKGEAYRNTVTVHFMKREAFRNTVTDLHESLNTCVGIIDKILSERRDEALSTALSIMQKIQHDLLQVTSSAQLMHRHNGQSSKMYGGITNME